MISEQRNKTTTQTRNNIQNKEKIIEKISYSKFEFAL